MIKHGLYIILTAMVASITIFAEETEEFAIGEEYIQPLKYPKFTLAADYNILSRFHGLQGDTLRAKLENSLGYNLSIEMGLIPYLNAGAMFSLGAPNDLKKLDPVSLRFLLFAKPYFPLGNRFSIFSRIGGGAVMGFSNWLDPLREGELRQELESIYDRQGYSVTPFGATGLATIGLEFFPLSRVGISFEAGIKIDYIYARKGNVIHDLAHEITGSKPKISSHVPNSLHYLVYSVPLMTNLHIIF